MNKRARWATKAMCPRTFWDGFTHKNPPHKPGPDCVDRCEFTDIAGPGDICICKACNPAKVIRKGRVTDLAEGSGS